MWNNAFTCETTHSHVKQRIHMWNNAFTCETTHSHVAWLDHMWCVSFSFIKWYNTFIVTHFMRVAAKSCTFYSQAPWHDSFGPTAQRTSNNTALLHKSPDNVQQPAKYVPHRLWFYWYVCLLLSLSDTRTHTLSLCLPLALLLPTYDMYTHTCSCTLPYIYIYILTYLYIRGIPTYTHTNVLARAVPPPPSNPPPRHTHERRRFYIKQRIYTTMYISKSMNTYTAKGLQYTKSNSHGFELYSI